MKIKNLKIFPALIVLIRVLFGIGWLLAGITKITEKSWFKQPGVFLKGYFMNSLQQPNVPFFYKDFIENIALEHLLLFNYILPIAQIILGIFLIAGLFTITSILICLFMHINFMLSGNINLISIILYTNAFLLIIFKADMYYFSLDKFFNRVTLLASDMTKGKKAFSLQPKKEKLFNNF